MQSVVPNRQIVLDTETTGLNPKEGHRIIEIGCVELINRRFTGNTYHVYINPEREIEQEAINVHGITNQFLMDKPVFRQIADEFYQFIEGSELVIHNAAFDVGFIDHEFANLRPKKPETASFCAILDTLMIARKLHPGQKNNLDALCRRYGIDNSHRTLHGALLDAEILADVYLLMTGGQVSLNLASETSKRTNNESGVRRLSSERKPLKVISATVQEIEAHNERLALVAKKGGACLWSQ
jgi:DNA polymerase-3 subunit epsilon